MLKTHFTFCSLLALGILAGAVRADTKDAKDPSKAPRPVAAKPLTIDEISEMLPARVTEVNFGQDHSWFSCKVPGSRGRMWFVEFGRHINSNGDNIDLRFPCSKLPSKVTTEQLLKLLRHNFKQTGVPYFAISDNFLCLRLALPNREVTRAVLEQELAELIEQAEETIGDWDYPLEPAAETAAK